MSFRNIKNSVPIEQDCTKFVVLLDDKFVDANINVSLPSSNDYCLYVCHLACEVILSDYRVGSWINLIKCPVRIISAPSSMGVPIVSLNRISFSWSNTASQNSPNSSPSLVVFPRGGSAFASVLVSDTILAISCSTSFLPVKHLSHYLFELRYLLGCPNRCCLEPTSFHLTWAVRIISDTPNA